jgi:hypothetical protein
MDTVSGGSSFDYDTLVANAACPIGRVTIGTTHERSLVYAGSRITNFYTYGLSYYLTYLTYLTYQNEL